jgi:HlyD family secretion protein
MDIPRPSRARARRIRRAALATAGVLLLALITLGLSRLEPAVPAVERSLVWTDVVQRGPMVRQVRGAGNLVPEEIRWIPATTDGRVERILALPGKAVSADTVLVELSNPEVRLAADDAEAALEEAESALTSLEVQLQSELLTQRAMAATVAAEARQAALQSEADAEMAAEGLIADLKFQLSKVHAEDSAQRAAIERERLEILDRSIEAQLDAQRSRVARLRATAALRRLQVEQLQVRAGTGGVLQQLPVEVGQRVTPGTNLARVAEPGRLKARIRIAETQARDVQPGQTATIDTRNGVIDGVVTRVDPAVLNGTVTVDVALEGPLPRGARPDLSVDGVIELERLEDVLHVGRPAFGQEQSTVGLFRLSGDGRTCVRIRVQLGRSSVTAVEVLDGLSEGDEVVLSDMSAWDEFDRIRLKG